MKAIKAVMFAAAIVAWDIALLASPVHAQTPDFKAVDTNADGQVTLGEAAAAGLPWNEELFQSLDTDANGALSQEEFVNALKQ